jgi:hypothetical protein
LSCTDGLREERKRKKPRLLPKLGGLGLAIQYHCAALHAIFKPLAS